MASSTIFWVFDKTWSGIEFLSPGPLANTLLIKPMRDNLNTNYRPFLIHKCKINLMWLKIELNGYQNWTLSIIIRNLEIEKNCQAKIKKTKKHLNKNKKYQSDLNLSIKQFIIDFFLNLEKKLWRKWKNIDRKKNVVTLKNSCYMEQIKRWGRKRKLEKHKVIYWLKVVGRA